MDSEFNIFITEEAASNVLTLMKEKGQDGSFLRVWVAGGGCSGLQYGMALDESIDEDDIKTEDKGVTIIVDSMSATYLSGATIEYRDDLLGGGFKIENPNAIGGCGCGSSFQAEGNDAGCGGCGGCGS